MAETNDVYWLVSRAGEIELDGGRKFWKELIREGRWINAKAGFTLQVDRGRLAQWARNFHEMAGAGIRVPVPWGHSYDPRDNAGFVEEIELRDGGLWALLNVPNEDDAAKVGATVRAVSVSVNPNFIDGSGRNWGEVIEHVALTNYPVVTDQGDFIQAGDEGEGKRAIALELAPDDKPVDFAAIAEQLGIDGELNRGNFTDAVRLRFDELNTELESCRTELMELRATHVEPDDGQAAPDSKPGTRNSKPGTQNSELGTQNPELESSNSELTNRLYQLELERAEREVDDALRLGKFTRPAAEALRQLIAAGVERKYSFDAADAVDVTEIALDIIANTPAGAAVDMTEHTRIHPVPQPGNGMTAERAAQLARENKALAKV
ncbi:MAG: hypothetical protein ABIF82_03560 [Planctomycetota bacterium]